MQITLFVRTYPVADAPVAVSLFPDPPGRRHTYTRDGAVYDPVRREVRVRVPDGSVVDEYRGLLRWAGGEGPVKSTAAEVYALVRARAPGFGTAP